MSNFTLFLNIRKVVNKLFAMNHLEKKFCDALFEECTLKVAFCALLSFLLNNIKLMELLLRQDTVRKILRANCIHTF